MAGENPTSWWMTLPGLLAGLAAVITAVTGLVLGLTQIGLFDLSSRDSSPSVVAQTEGGPSTSPPATTSNSPTAIGTSSSSKGPGGTITVPLSGATVKEENSVTGTANNIPEGHQLWIVTAYGQEYFPDGGPFQASASGRWSGTMNVGGTGGSFTVHLVAAGPGGSQQFTQRLKEGDATGNYIDILLEELASDVIFLDSISITR